MRRFIYVVALMLLAVLMLPTAAMALQMNVYSAIFSDGGVSLEKNGVQMQGGAFELRQGAPVGLSARGGRAALYLTRPNGDRLRVLYGNTANSAFDIRGKTDKLVIFPPFMTDCELEFSEDSMIRSVVLQSGVDINCYGRVERLTVFSDSEVDIADTAHAQDIYLRNERSSIRVDSTAHVNRLHCVSRAQTAVIYDLDERER